MNPEKIFSITIRGFDYKEIRLIRKKLGKTNQEFADMFRVGKDLVAAWQKPPTLKKDQGYREPSGPSLILLYWAAVIANKTDLSIGDKIRLGSIFYSDE